jgi:hypothetical protein
MMSAQQTIAEWPGASHFPICTFAITAFGPLSDSRAGSIESGHEREAVSEIEPVSQYHFHNPMVYAALRFGSEAETTLTRATSLAGGQRERWPTFRRQ